MDLDEEPNSHSFDDKLDRINLLRPPSADFYRNVNYCATVHAHVDDDDKDSYKSNESFERKRIKNKEKALAPGLIIQDKVLPSHKLIRRKGLSLLKYTDKNDIAVK